MARFKGRNNRQRSNNNSNNRNNGNPYGGPPGNRGQPNRQPSYNNNARNNSNKPNKGGCTLCGATRHYRNQCEATQEEKQAYFSHKSSGEYDTCIHCNKGGSHLPSNCFKNPNSRPAAKGDRNNNKTSRNESCEFCKRNTDHTFADCPEETKWTETAEKAIETAFEKLPYCIVCGSEHLASACDPAQIERRKEEFRHQSRALVLDWLRSPRGAALPPRDVSFCGYCAKFCNHNTLTCTDSAYEYHKNETAFLAKRFIKVSDADQSEKGISAALVDGKTKQKVSMALVERKCPKCQTVLPRVVRTEGQTEQRVMVTCPNPKCDKASWLPVQDEDDESPAAGGLDQWALSKKKSRKSKDAGAEDEFFPCFARFGAMPTPKGQPWYEGGSIQTWRARRNPHEYSQEGKWSFNDMGNFQPFFPPVPCKFTFRDCEIRDEPNLPINRARAGLVPYCFRCHQTGAVKDEDDEFVMAQSGLGMEGNLAGAGVGEIVFENPLHRFGVYNGEQQFLPDGKCWCTVKQGLAPSISWVEMR